MEKCNHLVPRSEQTKKCDPSDPESRIHYWIPSGRKEAIFNGLMSIDFCCKYCTYKMFLARAHCQFYNRLILSFKRTSYITSKYMCIYNLYYDIT